MKNMKKQLCLLLGAVMVSGVMMAPAGAVAEGAAPEISAVEAETVSVAEPAQRTVYDYDRNTAYARLAEWQDPDYISDEDFFGQYRGGELANPGKLDYDRIPGLSAVKAAVEQNNYPLAKEELLSYYRAKFGNVPQEKETFTREAMLSSQMLEYDLNWNTNSNITPLDIITVPADPGEVVINMAPTLKTLRGNNEELTVYLMGMKKDGSVAEFDSRNKTGGKTPTLEVTIDGVTAPLAAMDDTYVSPGQNHANINGLQDTFLVEESVSSIGVGKDKDGKTVSLAADLNTKRGLLRFDIASIPENADISNAVIRLWGENIGLEGNTGDMQVAAFSVSNFGWTEEEMTYYGPGGKGMDHLIYSWYGDGAVGYLPTKTVNPIPDPNAPGKVFCGHRYPEEILRFSKWISYPVTGFTSAAEDNEHYAFIALKQFAYFLDERGDDPKYDSAQPLDIANRATSWAKNLKLLVSSGHMTPELWTALVKYMWSMGMGHAEGYNGGTNGGTYQITGYNYLNVYFSEFREHYAWAQNLRDYAEMNVALTLHEDGSGIEGGLGYVANSLRNMSRWTEPNELMGLVEAESLPYSPELKGQIAKGLRYVMHMTGPGYVDNQIGDGGNHKTSYKGHFKTSGELLGDDYLLYAGTDGAQGTPDPIKSVLYPTARRLVMRTGWGGNDLYLFNETNDDKKHCQFDDGNIVMFAYGNYLLTDQLYFNYTSSDPNTKQLKSSLMHNTVNMNQKNQKQFSGGAVNLWQTNQAFDISNLRTNNVQDANYFDRSVVFIKPGYYIVSDYIDPKDSTKTNHYSQDWHMLPTSNMEIDPETGQMKSHFEGKANLIIAQDSMENLMGTVKTDGLYSEGNSHLVRDVKYAVYEQDAQGPATYNTVLYPEKVGGDTAISTEALPVADVQNNGASAMHVTIEDRKQNTVQDAQYYMVHDFDQQAMRSYGDYGTDARFNYVEKDRAGRMTRVLMQGGTLVQRSRNSVPIVKSLQPLQDLGIEFSVSTMAVSTSQEDFDIKNITVLTDRTIDSVTLNGEPVPFQQEGAYLYFGEEPIIKDPGVPAPLPTVSPTEKPPVHGGSGGGGGGGVPSTPKPSVTPAPTAAVTPQPTEGPAEDPKQESRYFDDVTRQAPWAAEAVDYLYEKNIISGVAQGVFAPEKSVTREELVKMMVLAMGLEPAEAALPFADVPADHWARSYIAAAYAAGVVQGISDTNFGLGQAVSRQDLAVLCDRALYGGSGPQGPDVPFGDTEQIAPYALESVQKLRKSGVVDGGGNNLFRPLDAATRGECAKIVYAVITR